MGKRSSVLREMHALTVAVLPSLTLMFMLASNATVEARGKVLNLNACSQECGLLPGASSTLQEPSCWPLTL